MKHIMLVNKIIVLIWIGWPGEIVSGRVYGSILKSRIELYANDPHEEILKKVYDKNNRCPTTIYKNLI